MNREPTTAADYAGIEAASEWAEHGDEWEPPDVDERGSSMRVDFGPNDHTCGRLPGITCAPCVKGRAS